MKDEKNAKQTDKKISRRQFMGGTAAAAMAFTLVPGHVMAQPPSGKLNIAGIGIAEAVDQIRR